MPHLRQLVSQRLHLLLHIASALHVKTWPGDCWLGQQRYSAARVLRSPGRCCACRALPSSLLLLSRAFTITQADSPRKKGAEYERLKETIGALPNKVITEAGMEAKTDE